MKMGCDIVQIIKIRSAIEEYGERYLRRLFTPKEQGGAPLLAINPQGYYAYYAKRIAAKEALSKAYGTGFR